MAFSLVSLDPLIRDYSLLKHPFYVRWVRGDLCLEDLRVYAREYAQLVRRIPGIVEKVRDLVPPQYGERLWALAEENRKEEIEHVSLWGRFAKSVGVSPSDFSVVPVSPKVRAAVSSIERLAKKSFGDGVTVMYCLERELAQIAETKLKGLFEFYGLTTEDARCYFEEHLKEEDHLKVWREVPVASRSRETAKQCLQSQNKVLDAICELRGIPLTC